MLYSLLESLHLNGNEAFSGDEVKMLRYILVFMVSLWAGAPTWASSWAISLFETHSKDFGPVPRGPTLSYPFRIKNKTNATVHIAGYRVSCGCVSARILKHELAPGEETAVLAYMDTQRFSGHKAVTLYVQFDRPRWEEVALIVQATSRDDFSVVPDTISMGRIKRATSPMGATSITFRGHPRVRILESKSDSNYVITSIQELPRYNGETTYRLSAKLHPELPVGKWYTDIWVKTDNPTIPRIRVPLTVEVEPTLNVAPSLLNLGEVKVGSKAERKVIVRGSVPFRIVAIRGTDGQVTVNEKSNDSRPVHVLTVTLKPAPLSSALPAGGLGSVEWNRRFRIVTDLNAEHEIEFQARAFIVP